MTVNDGTYTGKYALTVCSSGATITIIDGYFEGMIKNNAGSNGHIIIQGGTFTVDPSPYVVDGYTATNNGNGTWTVS